MINDLISATDSRRYVDDTTVSEIAKKARLVMHSLMLMNWSRNNRIPVSAKNCWELPISLTETNGNIHLPLQMMKN